MKKPNTMTRKVMVKDVCVGGGAPVVVQTMLNLPTVDVRACLAAINQLQAAGCELIRVALPDRGALGAFATIATASPLPVIADIHFDASLAIAAVKAGASKLRINPGNIGPLQAMDAILDAAGSAGVPIRIGVNAGSLASEFAASTTLSLPEKLVASAQVFTDYSEQRGFEDMVISVKAHDVNTTVQAYRLLSQTLPKYPLHLGVTEAGTILQGTVKSAIGIGTLLMDGIGDTLRVSLTADPVEELKVAWQILASVGLRRRRPEIISCPTCARCQVDLIDIASKVEEQLECLESDISVAVMGCVVNGPGEAKAADVGVACGKGQAAVFSRGKVLYTVAEDQIVTALLKEAKQVANQ